MNKRIIISLLTIAIVVSGGVPLAKGQDFNSPSTADLQRRIQELEATVRQMQNRQNAGIPAEATVPAPPVDAADSAVYPASAMFPDSVTSSLPPRPTEREGIHTGGFPMAGWNKGFYLRSDDDSYELHITGQLQADYRGFMDDVDTATSPDTFLIRRARLGIEGTVFKYCEFRLLPDFAGSSVTKSIADAYVNIHYWDALQLEMGKFKQPFSYEQLIQDRYVPTMERSMIDQLVPQRDEGLMLHGRKLFGDRLDYAVAVSNGDQNTSTVDSNNSKDFNTRLVVRPFSDPSFDLLRGLQFGASYGVGIENQSVSPNDLTTPATVEWFAYNNGVLANGVRTRVSPELVYFHGPFGLATQYYHEDQQVQASASKPVVHVQTDGYYIMASWLLTGEQRTDYTQQIDPVRPFSIDAPIASPGAWELIARLSKLDVDPEVFAAKLATPGVSSLGATEITCGFNWYLTRWIRTQFNWEHAWFSNPVQIGNEHFPLTTEDALYTRFQLIF